MRFFNRGVEVTSLPVLTAELILQGHVTDSAGQPAQIGTVTFEYCSYRGLPTNDITRPDEAPLAECAAGVARWRSLLSQQVNQSGDARMTFGFVRIPRTIGFRIKYTGGKNLIASGYSLPRDFTWTAQ